ncbi:hypothetical protein AX15_000371 [Amanita polypyramis BW_CC]|nr:hypothetical protein AX15_000371 [Amanita polypyramis BW_CC]
MARFRAYTSDSSSDDDDDYNEVPEPGKRIVRPGDDSSDEKEQKSDHSSGDESTSSSSSVPSPQRRKSKRLISRGTVARRTSAEGEVAGAPYTGEMAVCATTSSPPPPGHPADSTILPWAQQIGVDAQRMHIMQTSLFRMPEEAVALKVVNQPPPARPTVRKAVKPLNRKHSRDSEGDGLRGEPQERSSFDHDVEPAPYRPFRKYARVEGSSSIVSGYESAFFDAGLALGKSFRVGWGPQGILTHVGTICGPYKSPKSTSPPIVKKIIMPLFFKDADQTVSSDLSTKLLQHHLTHTPITSDDAGVPLAYPSLYPTVPQASTTQPSLNFASFASLFPSTDNTVAAQLFRLGSALFDPIDPQLPRTSSSDTTDVTPDIRDRIALLRRKGALSKWLKKAVKQDVEVDLQAQAQVQAQTSTSSTTAPSPKPSPRPELHIAADDAFTYLTGYQIKKAAEVASDAGYIKLATLISQAAGDAMFRVDMRSQLKIWEDEKVMPFIEGGVRKIYTLLAGLTECKVNSKDIDLYANLDWKRIFGLCLWYGESVTSSIADVFEAYEALARNSDGKVARPFPPWYDQRQAKTAQPASFPAWSSSPHLQSCDPEDPLYALIRLHSYPALSLSHVLNPVSFGFGASRVDWSMCWHMYIILSRVMRVRDFADREDLRSRARSRPKMTNGALSEDETEEDLMEGHSPSADLLASSYAFQLEAQGMLQEAVFVLLHIEGSTGRERAIKDLLTRSASKIDEWMTRGLVGSLKIPLSWVNEAKALHSLDTGDVYNAYELYLAAGLYDTAHDIAVLELAPDAILRQDMDLLKDIFERFEGKEDKVDGWSIRGKILLEYVHLVYRLTALQEGLSQDPTSPADPVQAQELDELTRRLPKVIGLLPDVMSRRQSGDSRHAAALEQMVKELIGLIDKTKPSMLSQIHPSTLGGVDEATKLGIVKGTGYTRFLKSIEIGVYA